MADDTTTDQQDQRDADPQEHDESQDTESLGDKGREALKREREARKAADKRAADLEKQVAAFEKSQKDRDDEAARKNGEWEKLAKDRETELETLRAQIAERDLNDLKRTIAKDEGLPGDLALRLAGADEDELRKDAKALAKHLKAQDAPDTDAGERSPRGTKKPDKSEFSNPARWGLRG